MNFDQIIEALGLRRLAAAASSHRQGTGGAGQPPPSSEPGPQQPGPPEDLDEGDAEVEATVDDEDDSASPSFDWSADDAEDADDDVLGGVIEEIHHQLDQVAADVDANTSQIRGIQSQHEEVIERLDTIEEHNSQLLGVYDRLTAGINPFAEGWEARYDRVRENAENAENRYNVVELPEGVEQDPVAPTADEPSASESRHDAEPETDDESVGFEELRERRGEEAQSADTDPADAERTRSGAVETATDDAAGSDAYLQALARGYASEVLLMEWLTMLIDIAGPPGTLKALDYYESIGWISRPVKHRLEDLLGGARVRADTPVRTPGDLTTEEHNRSFAYIMKLAQEHQTRPTIGPD